MTLDISVKDECIHIITPSKYPKLDNDVVNAVEIFYKIIIEEPRNYYNCQLNINVTGTLNNKVPVLLTSQNHKGAIDGTGKISIQSSINDYFQKKFNFINFSQNQENSCIFFSFFATAIRDSLIHVYTPPDGPFYKPFNSVNPNFIQYANVDKYGSMVGDSRCCNCEKRGNTTTCFPDISICNWGYHCSGTCDNQSCNEDCKCK